MSTHFSLRSVTLNFNVKERWAGACSLYSRSSSSKEILAELTLPHGLQCTWLRPVLMMLIDSVQQCMQHDKQAYRQTWLPWPFSRSTRESQPTRKGNAAAFDIFPWR